MSDSINLEFISDYDRRFHSDPAQEESDLQQLMVKLGHPRSQDYLISRHDFDRLLYAASPAYRFNTFLDPWNFSARNAPRIILSYDQPLTKKLIRSQAKEGWQQMANALFYAEFFIRTTDVDLAEALQEKGTTLVSQSGSQFEITKLISDWDVYQHVCKMLEKYQGKGINDLRRTEVTPSPISPSLPSDQDCPTLSTPDAWL